MAKTADHRAGSGIELTTAPAYGSLRERLGKIAAGFVLPTIIIVGYVCLPLMASVGEVY